MTDARMLLFFAAVLVYALLWAERGFSTAVAPFCALSATALFFSLLGCFGGLMAAGWLYYGGAVCAAGYLVWRWAVQKKPLPRLSIGFVFFAAASLVFILSFWVRKPMFLTWDEFSFWGTAPKLAKLYGEFYTTAPVGWPWPATYPPALTALSYSAQFLGEGFVEWQVYAAYDMLAMSVVSALLAPFGKKQWKIAFPLAVTGFLAPFVFAHYTHLVKVSAVYLDSLADTPMGFLFGAVLLLYFGDEERRLKNLLPVCLALATLTLTKDTAFALALVAVVLIFIDQLLAAGQEPLKSRAKGALLRLGLCVVSVVGPFAGWSLHLSAAADVNRLNLGGTQNVGMLEMPLLFVRELFSPGKSEHFTQVLRGMGELFVSLKMTMVGSGLVVVLLLLAMAGFAALITKDAPQRRRCILFGVFSALGFAAYYLLITLTYIYIFREDQMFASYERYIYPYYMGWFLATLLLLGQSARESRLVVEGRAALLALCAVFCWRFAAFVPPAYSVLGFHTEEYAERRGFAQNAADVARQLPLDSNIFIVSQDDVGIKWFTYCYEFLPWQVDYGYGGGRMAPPGALPEGTPYYNPVTAEEWAALLAEDGVTHVFIDQLDGVFAETYGALFSDSLEAYYAGKTTLYEVEYLEESVRLSPVTAAE